MSGANSRDTRGNYCGRVAVGASKLSNEDWRQIESHRNRDRPTPWQALAEMYRVPVAELRAHFEACFVNVANDASAPVAPDDVPQIEHDDAFTWDERRTRLMTTMWRDLHFTSREIADALRVTEGAVVGKIVRMGLQRRKLAA